MTALWVGMALLAGWWALRLWLRVPPYHHAAEVPEQPVETPLSRGFARLAAAHPELSGVQLLADGPASLAVRILLARKAQHRLDLQYYIWRDDVAGLLLLDALQDAAARGVRVRLMIDDYGMRGLDSRLKILAAHPNAEVRLFNPHRLRRLRFPNYLVDLPRLNRRMHNKVFLVDDAAAILGGRNIGDEYFDPGNTAFQADLDMLVIGAVLPALTADFSRYWCCGSSVPLDVVVKAEREVPPGRDNETLYRAYETAVREGRVGEFFDDTDDFQWAPMTLFSDDPAKGLGRVAAGAMMADQLQQALLPVKHSLVLVAAYFVPMAYGIGILSRLARAGVAVDILTNSLQTNNALPTHAGYAPARKPLLFIRRSALGAAGQGGCARPGLAAKAAVAALVEGRPAVADARLGAARQGAGGGP
jgi:putative cardiolipin synthase